MWDSEGISESEDRVVESIFESVDADSDSGNDSDAKTKKRSGSHDKKQKKRAPRKSVRGPTQVKALILSAPIHPTARPGLPSTCASQTNYTLRCR